MPTTELEALRAAQRTAEAALRDAHRARDEAQARAALAERRLYTWGSVALLVALLGGAAVSQLLPLLLGAP